MEPLADSSLNNFKLVKRLGAGSFGEIFRVNDKKEEKRKVIKVIKLDKLSDSELRDRMISRHKEFMDLVKDHRASNMVDYQNVFSHENSLCVLMRYYKRGSLEHYISRMKESPEKTVDETQLSKWFKALFKVLMFMMKLDLVHDDIKPGNILLSDDEKSIYLADLTECYMIKGETLKLTRGTKLYMAPERLKSQENSSFKSDLWSVAVVIYELVYLRHPFETEEDILSEKTPSFEQPRTKMNVETMLNKILRPTPEDRPNVSEIFDEFKKKKAPKKETKVEPVQKEPENQDAISFLPTRLRDDDMLLNREELYKQIDDLLIMARKWVIIQGISGIGKSTLARQYAYRIDERSKSSDRTPYSILWFNAASADLVRQVYLEKLAPYYNVNRKFFHGQADFVQEIHRKMQAQKRKYLLVFDDARNYESVSGFFEGLDSRQFKVILTTSHDEMIFKKENNFELVILDKFNQREVVEYLEQSIKNRGNSANISRLAKTISNEQIFAGVLPVSLKLSARVVRDDNKWDFDDSIANNRKYFDSLTNRLIHKFTMTSWQFKLLMYLSYLEKSSIPFELVHDIANKIETEAIDSDDVNDCLLAYQELCLIEIHDNEGSSQEAPVHSICMHTRVQVSLIKEHVVNRSVIDNLLAVIDSKLTFVDENDIQKGITKIQGLLNHLIHISDSINLYTQELSSIRLKLADYHFYETKDFKKYFELAQSAFEIQKRISTDKSLLKARSLQYIGTGNFLNLKFSEALEFHEKALEMYRSVKSESEEVAKVLNLISQDYDRLEKFHSALDFAKQALELRKVLYPTSSNVLIAKSLTNAGIFYSKVGKNAKALDVFEQANDIFQSNHEVLIHLDVVKSLMNLGTTHAKLGDESRSIEFLNKSYEICKVIFGDVSHPETASALTNIANAYGILGNLDKKLEYLKKALKMRREVYVSNHVETAASLASIGNVYFTKESPAKALDYYREAYEMLVKIQALSVVDCQQEVASCLNNMGCAYAKLGQYQKALEFLKRAFEIRKLIHSNRNHPSLAFSLYNFGIIYSKLGDMTKSSEYFHSAAIIEQELAQQIL